MCPCDWCVSTLCVCVCACGDYNAARAIQSSWRAFVSVLERQKLKEVRFNRNLSARKIQAIYRMYKARTLLSILRKHRKRRDEKYRRKNTARWKLEMEGAAYIIQLKWRHCHRNYLSAKHQKEPLPSACCAQSRRICQWNIKDKSWFDR